MSEIRERIEREAKEPFSDYGWPLIREWGKGNLIPADEVDARINAAVAEAVRAEREKCAQEAEAWASGSGSNVADSFHRFAAAIREKDRP